MRHEAAGITTGNFPPSLQFGPSRFALEYHFEPGSPRDGVTMNVPLAMLNQVPAARCEWLVPGLLKEKVKLLAKSMPQRLRHKLGALEAFADAFCSEITPADTPLGAALSRIETTEQDARRRRRVLRSAVLENDDDALGAFRALRDLARAADSASLEAEQCRGEERTVAPTEVDRDSDGILDVDDVEARVHVRANNRARIWLGTR